MPVVSKSRLSSKGRNRRATSTRAAAKSGSKTDPLLSLLGSGKHLWADEHADDYVQRLRQG